MEIYIEDLLFKGIFNNDIFLNQNIDLVEKAVCIQSQVGNIPALYEIDKAGIKIEISTINRLIFSISIDLEGLTNIEFLINLNKSHYKINSKSNFVEFIKYLNKNEVEWTIDPIDTNDKSLWILFPSKTKILYCFEGNYWGFLRIICSDIEIYNKIG